MYEILGALAFAALVLGQVLAVLFVRHNSETPDSSGHQRIDEATGDLQGNTR